MEKNKPDYRHRASEAPTNNKLGLFLLFGGGYITIASVLVNYLAKSSDLSTFGGWLPVSVLVICFGIGMFLYLKFFKYPVVKLTVMLVQIGLGFCGSLLAGPQSSVSNLFFIIIPMIVLAYPPLQSLLLGLLTLLALYISHGLSAGFGPAVIMTLPQAGGFLFFGVVGYALVQQRNEKARAEDLLARLKDSHERLRSYSLQVEELAVEKERNRLAREIHDNLGHYLVALTMQLEVAGKLLKKNSGKAEASIAKAEQLARESLAAVRESIFTLRKPSLEAQTLKVLSERLINDFATEKIQAKLLVHGEEPVLTAPLKTALFRTIQEGLTNIRKHSNADEVSVTLSFQTDSVHVAVKDNGSGADTISTMKQSSNTGFGLQGLGERIVLLSGNIEFGKNGPDEPGYLLSVSVPYSGSQKDSLS